MGGMGSSGLQAWQQLMNGEGYALEVGMEGLGGGCGQGQGGRGVGEMGCCFWATGLGAADDKKKMQRTHPQRTCQLWRLSAGALSVVAPFNPFAYLVQRPQVGMELQESTEWLLSKGLVRDTAPSTPPTPPPTLVWINGLLTPLEEVAAGVTDQELMYKIAMEQQRVQVCDTGIPVPGMQVQGIQGTGAVECPVWRNLVSTHCQQDSIP